MQGAWWEVTSTSPNRASDPAELEKLPLEWISAHVPGTAADAVRLEGGVNSDAVDYDDRDWWFRTTFLGDGEDCVLDVAGLATIGDVWCNGHHVLRSESMFISHHVPVTTVRGSNQLVIRCAALKPVLATRRPRPRWRTLAVAPGLRWLRTSLMGRVNGWTVTSPIVGPWRPIALRPSSEPRVLTRWLHATCDGADGRVEVEVHLSGDQTINWATVEVAGATAKLRVDQRGHELVLSGDVRVAGIERWWPRTHGAQPLYPVILTTDGPLGEIELGRVGFREIRLDTRDGAFQFLVNGEPVFCRGATWWPLDPVSMQASDDAMRDALQLACLGNFNMLRVSAMATYETERFFELCDELGLLVWQDVMLAFNDPPDTVDFADEMVREVEQNLGALAGHSSLALVCGSMQVEEMAALMGLDITSISCPLLTSRLREAVHRILPRVPYIHTSPVGGALPFHVDKGPSNYFGVGLYLRPVEDVRRAGVRFAAECLFLSTPPDPATVEGLCGGVLGAGHTPRWKAAINFDPGRSWDMEDLRDHHVEMLLDVDARKLRLENPERALDAGRACNAELVERVFSEWRRTGSTCAGGLVLALRDQRPGAGWGLVDSAGRPKSTWYALARVAAPIAVLVTDEGLNGLAVHVVNDTDREVVGTLTLNLFNDHPLLVEQGRCEVSVPPRSSRAFLDGAILKCFRDVNYAYRFGPPGHDVAVATLESPDGDRLGQAFAFPSGLHRAVEADLGLRARAVETGTTWTMEISSDRLAQWVVPVVDGYLPADAWFHVAPGDRRTIELRPLRDTTGAPGGVVRAFNLKGSCPIDVPPS